MSIKLLVINRLRALNCVKLMVLSWYVYQCALLFLFRCENMRVEMLRGLRSRKTGINIEHLHADEIVIWHIVKSFSTIIILHGKCEQLNKLHFSVLDIFGTACSISLQLEELLYADEESKFTGVGSSGGQCSGSQIFLYDGAPTQTPSDSLFYLRRSRCFHLYPSVHPFHFS